MGARAGAGVKEAVQEQFGAAAAEYAVSAVHAGGPDLRAMLAAAELPTPRRDVRLLDVGTGAGHTAFAFSPLVGEVEALDLTQEMLEQVEKGARERGLSNIHCQLGDSEALPYADDQFDVVTCRLCAHHFQHPRAFVAEMARVLRPGGTFLLADSVAPEDPSLDTFFNAFELLRDPSHVRNHSRSQWQEMLREVGFESEILGSWVLHQDFAAWTRRMGTSPSGVAHLEHMFDSAHDACRLEFQITGFGDRGGERGVGIPCALLRARRAP